MSETAMGFGGAAPDMSMSERSELMPALRARASETAMGFGGAAPEM